MRTVFEKYPFITKFGILKKKEHLGSDFFWHEKAAGFTKEAQSQFVTERCGQEYFWSYGLKVCDRQSTSNCTKSNAETIFFLPFVIVGTRTGYFQEGEMVSEWRHDQHLLWTAQSSYRSATTLALS